MANDAVTLCVFCATERDSIVWRSERAFVRKHPSRPTHLLVCTAKHTTRAITPLDEAELWCGVGVARARVRNAQSVLFESTAVPAFVASGHRWIELDPRGVVIGSSVPSPNALQQEAMQALRTSRADGATRGLVVLATGLGKTLLSAFDFAAFEGKRALFIAHRAEILEQAESSWGRVLPGRSFGILGESDDASEADVVFASVQTLSRVSRLGSFARDAFDYVVVDEFHHASAGTYRRLLEHFRPRYLLGLTATPDRTDGASLLSLCDGNLVFERNLVEGIRAGLLVPFHYYAVKDDLDYESVPWRSGRFDSEALTSKMATEHQADQALREYRKRAVAEGRKTLVFCCSVEHARFMARYFNSKGLPAKAIDGATPEKERAEALEKFRAGALELLCSVDVFNEGLDVPEVNTVLMLRPTESPIVFLQQLGRGLRTSPSKPFVTIVDFIGNHRSFWQKPKALGNLLDRFLPPHTVVAHARAQTLPLPPGCLVEFASEAIDLLQRMVQVGSGELVTQRYQDLRVSQGRRPTAAELHAAHADVAKVASRTALWFDFVASQNDLLEEEQRVIERYRAWFIDVQNTPMNKCFKMVALLALLDQEQLHGSCTVAENAIAAFKIIASRRLFLQELSKNADESVLQPSDSTFVARWREMPWSVWAKGEGTSQRWFSLEGDRLESKLGVAVEDRDRFDQLTEELVSYRLLQHVERLRERAIEALSLEPEVAQRMDPKTEGSELARWGRYDRPAIAEIFGQKYSRPWQVGHLDLQLVGREHSILMVTLRKEEQSESRYLYADAFLSRSEFQWESQNSTTSTSAKGRNIQQSASGKRPVHLFVRYGKREKFVYCGCVRYVRHENEAPMRVLFQLEKPLPEELWAIWGS